MSVTLMSLPQRVSSLAAAERDPRVAKLWLNLPPQSARMHKATSDRHPTPSTSSTTTLVEGQLLTPPTSSVRKIRPLPSTPSTPDARSPRALPPVPQSAPIQGQHHPHGPRPGHRVTASTSSIPRHPSVLIPGRPTSHNPSNSAPSLGLSIPSVNPRPTTGDFHPTPATNSVVFPIFAAREIADELERLSINQNDEDTISPIDDEDADDLADLNEGFSVEVVRGVAYRAADVKRVSRMWHGRWVKREGGVQFDNPDYSSIMKALRAL